MTSIKSDWDGDRGNTFHDKPPKAMSKLKDCNVKSMKS